MVEDKIIPKRAGMMKYVRLWKDNPHPTNSIPLAKIILRKVNTDAEGQWIVLNLEELDALLRIWIRGEQEVYGAEEKEFRRKIRRILEEEKTGIIQDDSVTRDLGEF